jgi:hypothetical protein
MIQFGTKKIQGVELVSVGNGYSRAYRASYLRYRVFITIGDKKHKEIHEIDNLFPIERLKKLPYWVARSGVMAMTCWGTSQRFEAQLALAQFLGMKKKGEEWGDYCRRVEKLIFER